MERFRPLINWKFIFYLIMILSIYFSISCFQVRKPASGPEIEEVKNFDFYFNQGKSFLALKDYEKAGESFSRALRIEPNSFRAHNFCGLAYFWQKNYRLAEEHFLEAVRLNPSFAEAYTNLGGLYFAWRRFDEAKKFLVKAIELAPNSVAAHFSLGSLLLLQGEIDEGSKHLVQAFEIDPTYFEANPPLIVDLPSPPTNMAEVYFAYAKIYAQKGNIEKTVEYLEKARQAGFSHWERIKREKEFEAIREDPRIAAFLR